MKFFNFKNIYLLLATCYLLLAAPPTLAQELKLLPERDTYVDSSSPEKNFGKENKFSVAFMNSSKIAFLKFNLGNIAKDSQVQKAILTLELDQSLGKLNPIKTEVLLPEKDWGEEELNWNNKPSLFKTDLKLSLEATPGSQRIDITPLVRQWLDGSVKNYGLAIYQNGESFERHFCAREDEKKSPTLIFSWNKENPSVGGPALAQIPTNPKPLTILTVETKEASESATPSAQTTEEKSEKTEDNKKSVGLINSKNIVILILGLLALLTFVIEKTIKIFRQEQ